MNRVIMTCGPLCCGKTTYAQKLKAETGGVILSIDELMLTLFPEGAGEQHDAYVNRTTVYLLNLTAELAKKGVTVILDWGFWTRAQRKQAKAFFDGHGVASELHYLKIDDPEWRRRIARRNEKIRAGCAGGYMVDEGLLAKFCAVFEQPAADEADKIIDIS